MNTPCTFQSQCLITQYCNLITNLCLDIGPRESFPIRACDSAGWRYYDGYDIFGNDITFIETNLTSNCFTACESNPNCRGFSWTAHGAEPNLKPRCYLKGAGATEVTQRYDVISAYRCNNPTPQPNPSPSPTLTTPSPTPQPNPSESPTPSPAPQPTQSPTPAPTNVFGCISNSQCNGLCENGVCTDKCFVDTDCFNGYECLELRNTRICQRSSSYIYKPAFWMLIVSLFFI